MNKHNLFIFNFNKTIIFIIKLFLFLAIVLFFIFNILLPQDSKGYNASLVDKVNRLESINEPKIVLIGNSNLAFGIDSKLIEEHFDMPVVNMGLHGGLGNTFHENIAKLNVHKGDIYILCHVDYSDDGKIEDEILAWSTIENHIKLWKIIQIDEWKGMLYSFPTYLKKALIHWINETGNSENTQSVYRRSAFNEYGDNTVIRNSNHIQFHTGDVVVPQITDNVANRLNKLNKYLKDRGATLVIAGYPIGNGEYTPDKKEFEIFQKKLESKVDFPVISNFTNYMYDYSYFYDTIFHLNNEGAVLRTNQLIEDLQTYIDNW